MTNPVHCPMIHNGLQITLGKTSQQVTIQSCCLRKDDYVVNSNSNIWQDQRLIPLRNKNNEHKWDYGCWSCQGNENAGLVSFRTGMLEKFGIKQNLSGPQRLDLMFDASCNLACRTCGPESSTYWQKHLKDNNLPFATISPVSKADEMIAILQTLDLTNLEMVVFCGGETLMGDNYWKVANTIAELVPNAKEKLTISFQTNGTQSIKEKYFDIIEKFQLVKLHISLDGIGERFEYLRWPAKWEQVTANITNLREILPVNVMFLIEETISIFNLYYQDELAHWLKNNFSDDRSGDTITHTRHVATGIYSISNITQQYADSILNTPISKLINQNWVEKPMGIHVMIDEINKFDNIRGESWINTFPEVASFYSKYL